ncbi:MAG: PIN domain-containing protein [Cyclobacteriaceae bacterium]|nr:PIN domain-containing protein [Cyclobacteriaceae bacterium]
MEKLFLDTNLLLDFVLDRKPFSDQAERIIQLRFTHKKRLFTSALSIANVAYVVRKAGQNPFQVIAEMMDWVEIVNLTKAEFSQTIKSTFKDFEDALQFYTALEVGADVIITRDLKDFSSSSIPVNSPTQYLRTIKE